MKCFKYRTSAQSFFLVLFLSYASYAFTSLERHHDFTNLNEHDRPHFWAQRSIGTDLVRETFATELLDNNGELSKPQCLVIDTTGSDTSHGHFVSSLISHPRIQAVFPGKKCERKDMYTIRFFFTDLFRTMHGRERYVFNMSFNTRLSNFYNFHGLDFIKEEDGVLLIDKFLATAAKAAAANRRLEDEFQVSSTILNKEIDIDNKLLLIIAAGNNFLETSDGVPPMFVLQRVLEQQDIGLIVAGINSHGLPSINSEEGKEVSIAAPGDKVFSIDYYEGYDGNYATPSGTSFAAPLLTGAILVFRKLSGDYWLTKKQVDQILEKTAIPLLMNLQNPQKNGLGLLNIFKMANVARRLKNLCENDFRNRDECFEEEIMNNNTYTFPKPLNCGDDIMRRSDIDNGEKLKELRKFAFLNEHDKCLWRKISSIYRERESEDFWLYESVALAIELLEKRANGHEISQNLRTFLKSIYNFYNFNPSRITPFHPNLTNLTLSLIRVAGALLNTEEAIKFIRDELGLYKLDKYSFYPQLKQFRTCDDPTSPTTEDRTDYSFCDFSSNDFVFQNIKAEGRKQNFYHAVFRGLNLNGAKFLKGANLTKAIFENTKLIEVDLSETLLNEATFKGADLRRGTLNGSSLIDTNFENADLTNANINKANLKNANFKNTNLINVTFNNSNLNSADLTNAILSGASFENSDLTNIVLDEEDFIKINFLGAQCPELTFEAIGFFINLLWEGYYCSQNSGTLKRFL